MSYNYGTEESISLVAAADLSAKQYYAVKVDSAGKAAIAAAGEYTIGYLVNKPTAGQAATIVYGGVSKALLGGTVAAGATVAADANGKTVDATEARTNTSDAGAATDPLIASNVIGVALVGGVAGDIVPVLVLASGATPTTAA
ncbi:hypothetical protein UFOVP36_63 [uncultured Caudovirales phage]|uniref:Uncharacterized protein n=1 Tax=uncultured Caudovirales phage TaxID=2100421 RepID=A0A6J5KMY6_9CAUD|nr:hypothetical protein UFOVP36_63 [uncultured Caudovirales phage]